MQNTLKYSHNLWTVPTKPARLHADQLNWRGAGYAREPHWTRQK